MASTVLYGLSFSIVLVTMAYLGSTLRTERRRKASMEFSYELVVKQLTIQRDEAIEASRFATERHGKLVADKERLNDRMIEAVRAERAQRELVQATLAKTETSLVNALQSTDRYVRLIEDLNQQVKGLTAETSFLVRPHLLQEAEQRGARFKELADRLSVIFKEQTDKLFIDCDEQRQLARGLLESVTEATTQLVNISKDYGAMRRAGFNAMSPSAVADLPEQEPPRFASVDAADEEAAKLADRRHVVHGSD